MGFKVYSQCRYRVIGNPVEKAVLMALASYASDDGSSVYPSKHSLAAQLECSLRSVQNAVKKLMEKGILKRVGKRPIFMGGSIVYDIDLAVLTRLPNADPALTCLDEVVGDMGAAQAEGVQETTQGGAPRDTRGRRSCIQISNNPNNQNARPCTTDEGHSQKRHTTFKTAQGIWRKAAEKARRPDQDVVISQADKVAARERVQAMLAEKIRAGKYVPPSALSISQADALIQGGAVTPNQLDKLGIAFSVPWDRRAA